MHGGWGCLEIGESNSLAKELRSLEVESKEMSRNLNRIRNKWSFFTIPGKGRWANSQIRLYLTIWYSVTRKVSKHDQLFYQLLLSRHRRNKSKRWIKQYS
jgi:hypothetical protein